MSSNRRLLLTHQGTYTGAGSITGETRGGREAGATAVAGVVVTKLKSV